MPLIILSLFLAFKLFFLVLALGVAFGSIYVVCMGLQGVFQLYETLAGKLVLGGISVATAINHETVFPAVAWMGHFVVALMKLALRGLLEAQ